MTDPTPIIQPGELAAQRKVAGLTQAELARLTGYTQQTVADHERRARAIPLRASNAYRYVLDRRS